MAEAAEPEEKEEPKTEEPEEVKEDEGEEPDLTKEPGGDKPADVYARRRARELKQTREERDRLRENNIRMEERLRTLEEAKKEPEKPKAQELSDDEVQALIDKGEVPAARGYAYIAALAAKRVIEAERLQQQQQAPLVRSRTEIGEYVKYVPALGDQGSEEYAKANREFIELVNRGFESDDRTRGIAIRMAFGDLESLKKKQEMRSIRSAPNTPSDSGGGGGGGGGKPSTDISRAPADLVKYWNGAGLTPKERESHFKGWQARQAAKK